MSLLSSRHRFLPLLDCASSETLVRRVLTPRPGLLSALLVGVGRRRRSPIDNALAVVTACLEFDQDGEVLLFLVGRGADFIELAPRALLRVRDPCRLLQIAPSVARVSLTPQELSLQALELLADCLHDEYSLPDPSLFEICQPSSAVGMLVALMSLLRLEVCELRPVAAFLLRGCELVTDRRTGVIRHGRSPLERIPSFPGAHPFVALVVRPGACCASYRVRPVPCDGLFPP